MWAQLLPLAAFWASPASAWPVVDPNWTGAWRGEPEIRTPSGESYFCPMKTFELRYTPEVVTTPTQKGEPGELTFAGVPTCGFLSSMDRPFSVTVQNGSFTYQGRDAGGFHEGNRLQIFIYAHSYKETLDLAREGDWLVFRKVLAPKQGANPWSIEGQFRGFSAWQN